MNMFRRDLFEVKFLDETIDDEIVFDESIRNGANMVRMDSERWYAVLDSIRQTQQQLDEYFIFFKDVI